VLWTFKVRKLAINEKLFETLKKIKIKTLELSLKKWYGV
jgi:hypothetical protein